MSVLGEEDVQELPVFLCAQWYEVCTADDGHWTASWYSRYVGAYTLTISWCIVGAGGGLHMDTRELALLLRVQGHC